MTGTTLHGSPAHGARGTIGDLATLGWELLRPRLLMPEVVRLASTVAFPGLSGVVPGFGKQQHERLGAGLRDPRPQVAALDGAGELARHVRPLRPVGLVPVGRPGGRTGLPVPL